MPLVSRRSLALSLLSSAVGAHLEIPAAVRHGGDLPGCLLPAGPEFLQLAVNAGDVLLRRTVEILEGDGGEGPGADGLGDGLRLGPVTHDKQILQFPVGADGEQLRRGGRLGQRLADLPQVHRRGAGVEGDPGVLRAAGVQVQVQAGPGHQTGPLAGEPVILGEQLGDALHPGVDLRRAVEGGVHGRVAHELLFLDGAAVDEQAFFLGRVLLQGFQRTVDGVLPGLHIAQSGGIPLEQGHPLRVAELRLGLGDLHTPGVQQPLEQLVPLGGQGDDPQPFHLDDGH